jgi:hypothetical protein
VFQRRVIALDEIARAAAPAGSKTSVVRYYCDKHAELFIRCDCACTCVVVVVLMRADVCKRTVIADQHASLRCCAACLRPYCLRTTSASSGCSPRPPPCPHDQLSVAGVCDLARDGDDRSIAHSPLPSEVVHEHGVEEWLSGLRSGARYHVRAVVLRARRAIARDHVCVCAQLLSIHVSLAYVSPPTLTAALQVCRCGGEVAARHTALS